MYTSHIEVSRASLARSLARQRISLSHFLSLTLLTRVLLLYSLESIFHPKNRVGGRIPKRASCRRRPGIAAHTRRGIKRRRAPYIYILARYSRGRNGIYARSKFAQLFATTTTTTVSKNVRVTFSIDRTYIGIIYVQTYECTFVERSNSRRLYLYFLACALFCLCVCLSVCSFLFSCDLFRAWDVLLFLFFILSWTARYSKINLDIAVSCLNIQDNNRYNIYIHFSIQY